MAVAQFASPHSRTALWLRRSGRVFVTVGLLAVTLVVIIPFIWMLVLSLRSTGSILNDPYGLPVPPRWQNYTRLLFDPEYHFYQYFLNSVLTSGGAVILETILVTMAGYGFGRPRYDFKLRGALLAFLLLALMLPPQIGYIPQFVIMSKYGLVNTRWALILLYAAAALPVSIYLMSTYFSQLPTEFEDAARIDGCSEFGMFWRVMLPLATPALSTVVLLNFMAHWNELLLAISMTHNPALRTLPAQIWHFVGEHGVDYGLAATSLTVAAAPIFILYVFMSERFVEVLTAGGIKG